MAKLDLDYTEWGWWDNIPSPSDGFLPTAAIPLLSRTGEVRALAAVDREDRGWLNRWTWRLHQRGYGCRGRVIGGRAEGSEHFTILLHRTIMDIPQGSAFEVDHINGVKLDNRRSNLRIVTHAQNGQNFGDSPDRGVSRASRSDKWRARVGDVLVGSFETKEEARAAVKAHRATAYPYSNENRHERGT